jgi:tetratricopeptide (TPR) repeat protein
MSQLNRIVVLGAIWVSLGYADAGILSLRPLYTPETAVLNPALVDLWGTILSFRIEPDAKAGYRVILSGEQFLTFRLVQLGTETIADCEFPDKPFEPRLPMHRFARLRLEGNALRVDWLGSKELGQRIVRTGSPRHEQLEIDGEDVLLLTGSTAELQHFLLECLKQPDAFEDSEKFERAGPEPRAADLNQQSWAVVYNCCASPEASATALRHAEEAVSLAAGDAEYWRTLATARYRMGRFTDALAAIGRAESLRKEASPDDLALRAMTLQRLGQEEEARRDLDGLRQMLASHRYCGDEETRSLLQEAEKLIVPKGK